MRQSTGWTEAEYLVYEETSEYKNEYVGGYFIERTGENLNHNLIATRTVTVLHNQLDDSPCLVLASRMRTIVKATRAYTYPDIVVVCDEPEILDLKPDTLANPTLIIEILSPSTEANDRGLKFQHYREIESLREYILVTQHKPQIEHYIRQDDGAWTFREYVGLGASLDLPSIGCTLALSEVYEQVDFDSGTEPPTAP